MANPDSHSEILSHLLRKSIKVDSKGSSLFSKPLWHWINLMVYQCIWSWQNHYEPYRARLNSTMLSNIMFLKCNADKMDTKSSTAAEMILLLTLNSQFAKCFICVLCSKWDHKHMSNVFLTFHLYKHTFLCGGGQMIWGRYVLPFLRWQVEWEWDMWSTTWTGLEFATYGLGLATIGLGLDDFNQRTWTCRHGTRLHLCR